MTNPTPLTKEQNDWEKSTKYMLAKANINILMGNIIETCFSRWNEKEMLIAQKIEDLVSNYVLDEMMKLNNERKFYKKLQSQAILQERNRIVEIIGQKEKKQREKEMPGYYKYEIRNMFREELLKALENKDSTS